MACISIDLVEEILLKLRVKDLVRFKCACKRWLTLIRSRRFINRHYSDNYNQAQQLIILYLNPPLPDMIRQKFYGFYPMYDGNRSFLRLKEVKFHPNSPFCNDVIFRLMGPVNGIFCIEFISEDLALSNPAMRELRPLPQSPLDFRFRFTYGFGFDPSRRNLKLIALACYGSPNLAYMYDSITNSWKTIETWMTYRSIRPNEHHTFVNGVYYWFVDLDGTSTKFGIIAFDMKSDNFYQIEMPNLFGVSLIPKSYMFVGYGDSMALKLSKSVGCENCDCTGRTWFFDYNCVGSLCRSPNLGDHKFVSELWVLGKDGFWSRRCDEADWILPSTWRWIDTNHSFLEGHYILYVLSDHNYNESLISIKRNGEGEDDSIRAFLRVQTSNIRCL